jgi:hypothetical protein
MRFPANYRWTRRDTRAHWRWSPKRLTTWCYFEFCTNTMESFYGDTIPILKDKSGPWRQPESRTRKGGQYE